MPLPPLFDPVVEQVRADLHARSAAGIAKYGTTLARTDLSQRDWLQHLYEELLDAANYTKRAIMELDAVKVEDTCEHEYDPKGFFNACLKCGKFPNP